MSNELLDDVGINSKGVLIKKYHSQARLIFLFFTLFKFFFIVVMTEYRSLGKFDGLHLVGKLLFFGFLVYYNFNQLKTEKLNEESFSQSRKWENLLFLVFVGMIMIYSVANFIETISEKVLRFPSLTMLCIITSSFIIFSIELKYLKLKTGF